MDVLRIVEKSLHIVLDQIVSVENRSSDRDEASKEMARIVELRSLLRQHNVSVRTIELGPYQFDDNDVEYKSMSALHLYTVGDLHTVASGCLTISWDQLPQTYCHIERGAADILPGFAFRNRFKR